jgi:hypothetical protein
MMLRRGDGETQRQMRFADTNWPEQLSATWVFWGGRERTPEVVAFSSMSPTNDLPS